MPGRAGFTVRITPATRGARSPPQLSRHDLVDASRARTSPTPPEGNPGIDEVRTPACPSDAGQPADTRQSTAGPTVLLVEDEPALRVLFTRVLIRSGYRVTAFGNGAEALESVGAGPDLLLTDLTVPGRTGAEVAAAVASRFPGTPVLFISGHDLSAAAADQLIPSHADLITKPFTGAELLDRVRRAIAGDGPGTGPVRVAPGRRSRGLVTTPR